MPAKAPLRVPRIGADDSAGLAPPPPDVEWLRAQLHAVMARPHGRRQCRSVASFGAPRPQPCGCRLSRSRTAARIERRSGDDADRSSVLFRRGWVLEGHLDHRSRCDEIIEGGLTSVPTSSSEMLQDLPSGNRVCDHLRPAIKVEVSVSFQVYDEARISEKVRQPVPRARGPGDEEAAVDIEHPDLDSTRLSGSAAGRSDIDRRIVGELASDGLHRPDVRAAAPDGGARRSTSAASTLPPDTSDDMPIGLGRDGVNVSFGPCKYGAVAVTRGHGRAGIGR